MTGLMITRARVHCGSLPLRADAAAHLGQARSNAAGEATRRAAPITSATPTSSARSTFTPLDVAEAQRGVLLALDQHDQRAAAVAEARQRLGGLLGGRRGEGLGVDGGQRAAVGVHRQRGAQRAAALLAVDLDGVAARLGAEGDAAARALGRGQRADAGTAGALLAPGLGAGHGDLAAGHGGVGALAAGVQLGHHGAVHQRLVELLAEHGLVEVDLAGLGADVGGRRRPSGVRSGSRRSSPWGRAPSRAPAAGSRRRGRPRPRGPSG